MSDDSTAADSTATQSAGTAPVAIADAVPSAVAEDGQRRRRILIALIIGLVLLLLITAGALTWYLVTRKPLTQIPLLSQEIPPSYSQSFYDVTQPLGVAVDEQNSRVYVTQSSGDRNVVVFDLEGNKVGTLDAPAGAAETMHLPVYVAVNPTTHEVYVSDRGSATIYVYGPDGTFVREVNPKGAKDWAPLALTFDSTGNLYVSDVSAPTQKIWMIAPDGSVTRTFGEADKLSFPNGLAIASDGSVNVADSNKGRVLIYPAGSNAPTALPPGTTEAPLGLPRGMAIDDRGRLYIVDTVNNMVNVYLPPDTAGGAPVFAFSFGKEGIEEGSFEFPNGIAVDGRGRIYITDRENNRLQVWSY